MDDIWTTMAWDDAKRIFPDDDNGSRIMLTTRVTNVAHYAACFSSHVYVMRFMNAHESWNLLRHKVFKDEHCPVELENIGKEIARICGGLPLAVVVIAGLLSTVSKTRASWEEIAEYVESNVATENDGQIGKVLSLSYRHLPHHLRPCFLYMGAFPEDYDIRVNELTKLWVAEGFMQSSGSKSVEEEAYDYLEDLVKRSLFLATKRKSNGKIKSCSIHDLVRDLCIRKAHEEKFLHLIDDSSVGQILPESIGYKRRLAIAHSDLNCISGIHGSSTRTIICCKHTGEYLVFRRINFRLLRILHIVDAPISDLPTTLFELFHLRYLGFCYTSTSSKLFFPFPAQISNLQNLQTLIIHVAKIERDYGNDIVNLPLEIWRMPQLRHLVCFLFDHLPTIRSPSFLLENLQTLSAVSNFIGTEQILKMIPNLKKLGISYSGCTDNIDHQLDNLVHLQRLEKLKLVVHADFLYRRMLNPVFPETLKKLTLSGLELPWEDMTMIGSLPNLEVLKLRDYACKGERWETSEGEFAELKYLLINLSNLHEWTTERSHFPRLKCLLLHHCPDLVEIPDGIGEIPTLELIEIKGADMNKSLVESAKRIQDEQQDYDNDVLQFRFIA